MKYLIISSLLALTSCGFPFSEEGSPERELSVSMRHDRTDMVPGAAVTFTITARNSMDEDAVIHGSSSCFLAFHVRGFGGEIVAQSDQVCTADFAAVRVPANGEVTKTLTWNGTGNNGVRLPVGEYRVNAVLQAAEVRKESDPFSMFIR